jgi:ribonucleoside-diphosphate reductase alpha chain
MLCKAYFGESSYLPDFDYRDIREKGATLVTAGGKAPGPEPLKLALEQIKEIFESKKDGDKLTSLECHDIICFLADAVLSGGIRRAALIALFSWGDMDMQLAKSNYDVIGYDVLDTLSWGGYDIQVTVKEPGYGFKGHRIQIDADTFKLMNETQKLAWWNFQPQRGRANNSVVLLRNKIQAEDFFSLWKDIEDSKAGEPGFLFTNDKDAGTNPCAEINLKPNQFCNLCEIMGGDIESQEDLNLRAKYAAFIGTLQASYTDFHYLRDIWRKTTEKEALLGIGMTGIAAGEVLKYNLSEAAKLAVIENERVAKTIGINKAARVTTVKPSGTTSLVLGTSSGIHAWHDDYYLRRMRIGKNEALYTYLTIYHPDLLEDDKMNPKQACVTVPQKAPEGAITRPRETALTLLERIKKFNKEWIAPGHRKGANMHNVSATVNIKDNEWKEVGEWLFKNRDYFTALSFLPHDGHTYIQSPFETINKKEYDKLIPSLHNIDLSKILEFSDNTTLTDNVACSGGACEIV